MNNLLIFDYESKEIRTITQNEEVWWVAKDVCEVFGETNRNRAMQSLDEDEKGYTQIDTPGGKQNMAIINESGLYSLLFAMRPEKARGVTDEYIVKRQDELKRFKRWVTHEILPTLRKTGSYTKKRARRIQDAPISEVTALLKEVSSFLREMDKVMRDQDSHPSDIAEEFKNVCDQFGIVSLSDGFVRETQVVEAPPFFSLAEILDEERWK